ncbi:MAG: hypothetical protein M1333_01185 [Patescibacteria group bacterium]|nr:hypothetical protein [Patescibacteria group bacterium]
MENKITHNVLEQIKSGQVKMHSRAYFILRTCLSAGLVFLAAVFTWFFFSLMFFVIQRHNAMYLPLFGLTGVKALLVSFPWFVLALGVVLFVVFDMFLNNYSLAYRRPAAYTVLGVIVFLLCGVGVVHATGLNSRLHDFLKSENFPVLTRLYEFSENGFEKTLLLGRVEEVDDDGFVLMTSQGKQAILKTGADTKYSNGRTLQKGETLIVGAKQNGDRYDAYGVRKVKRRLIRGIINNRIEKNAK